MTSLPHRRLGSSDLDVSVFALGSWRTFERLPREQSLAIMSAARDSGVTFLDDARYNDETGTAPIPTGYSEVLFGDLFRAAGWQRDQVVVANKLWWEFWPEQDAVAELDASLGRMQLEHVDLIYTMQPPAGLSIAELVAQVATLISSGRARAWGIGNWTATDLVEAVSAARALGAPLPVAAQLPYSVVTADWVEDPLMDAVLADANIGLVASFVLAGGVLTGKYTKGETGRANTNGNASEAVRHDRHVAELVRLAKEWGVTPADLAFSFALAHPRLASVLFGATSPAQLRQNIGSLEVFNALSADQLAQLRAVATSRG